MRQDRFSKENIILYTCGLIPTVWFALKIAPFVHDGLVEIIPKLGDAFNHPFQIMWCEDSSVET